MQRLTLAAKSTEGRAPSERAMCSQSTGLLLSEVGGRRGRPDAGRHACALRCTSREKGRAGGARGKLTRPWASARPGRCPRRGLGRRRRRRGSRPPTTEGRSRLAVCRQLGSSRESWNHASMVSFSKLRTLSGCGPAAPWRIREVCEVAEQREREGRTRTRNLQSGRLVTPAASPRGCETGRASRPAHTRLAAR